MRLRTAYTHFGIAKQGTFVKIALISEHASPLAIAGGVDSGGQNIYVANVARQLVRIGHDVDVFTRCDRSLLPLISRFESIRVINVPAGPPVQLPKEQLLPHMDAFAAFMIDFMKNEAQPYDIVHANFFMSGLVGLRIKDALGVPLVTTFHALGRVRRLHQGESDGFPDARFDIEDELVRRSDSVIAECPQDENDLIHLYDADAARIDLVPCGFDRAEFHPLDKTRAREKLGWPQDRFIVLQLGRMVPRKGVDSVVRALAALRFEHGESAELYVAGGNSDEANEIATPDIGRLRGIARECGIEEHVHFVGRHGRSELKHFYNAADVFVTTPWYEPFGITPLEAMACGRPVIGADVGGIRYSVAHGETGLLVPPKNPWALADALVTLKRDPALAERMGEAGLARANAMFTWSSVAQALAQVYARLCGDEGQAAERVAMGGAAR